MPAGKFNLTGNYKIEQGVDWDIQFRWKKLGVAVELATDWTAELILRESFGNKSQLLKLEKDDGITLTNGLLNTPNIYVVITKIQAALLLDVATEWNLELNNTVTDKNIRLLEGEVKVSTDKT